MKRAIVTIVTVLAAGVVAVLVPIAPARAATPHVDILQVTLIGGLFPRLHAEGTVTCSEPTGQAQIALIGVQFLDFAVASGDTTAACAAGPVAWQAELHGSGLHPGQVTVNWLLSRNGSLEANGSENFTL